MTIKSDRWIRRMAQDHGMIEPFIENQVRQGVISYGLSSYGYDMRIANEFKVFTNVFNTLVDPKHFDARSFVDITADYCDIPPNSFALARTVEYFRIPRNVLALCVGKSTYARCFRGDTRVALIDGTAPSLEKMALRAEQGEQFWGYSIGANGRMIVSLLDAPRYIGRDTLVEVRIDNDAAIFCTPDHQFLMRDGRMVAAGGLRPGDSLMPLYRYQAHGSEMAYQPLSGQFSPTQRMADEWKIRNRVATAGAGAYRQPAHQHTASWSFLNHKVVGIRETPGDHDVFCLTVPEAGNFALQAGVFVHNCGIIVNTTPFEPGWRGYVTLELSNSTPLPARIYANEGIGQVLFFESDEDCETSYDDKQGKYLDQVGVVPPRL